MTTTNLNISLVAQNQAQKEVTVNEAISVIDAILNRGAIDKGTNTTPGSPSEGDLYIIGSSPTGDWAGEADNIAYYNSTWKFITPNEGMSLWVNDEDMQYTWDGAAWALTTRIKILVSASSTAAYAVDFDTGIVFEITLTANCTFTFTNPPASGFAGEFKLILIQDGTGSRTATWPVSAKWVGGTAPTLTTAAASVDIVTFVTTDDGTTWYGRVDGLDVK